ncbi:protein WALLS ARE THIN 1 [Prunus yedoensis var. nudiflora]|uniref:WAT1-related protein n=1 Tax=Prunus yedoensis var. nudiflora TaxID=2094558 RepID=A0A314YCS5_PRUYE|nr:protein WALLS ARE THIN 1 [Prunus yedoensis var. nudiflora]
MADAVGSASAKRMCCSVPERLQLHGAMLALQFGYAGFHVVSRAALNMGISKLVFPVYRNIIALLMLLPFAYFLEKKDRPAITLNFLVQFFLLALIGITANQGFYLLGLDNTSPTFASAIQNSVPAITFLMAAVLRIEHVRLKPKRRPTPPLQMMRLMGNATSIVSSSSSSSSSSAIMSTLGDANGKSWTLGCLYLIGHCLSWSGWLVFQAPVLKKYPARLSVTSYTCFFGLIQFIVIAAIFERDAQAWIFHNGGEVFSILYAGVVASGIAFAVQIWCIDRGGPVFVAVYQPVQTLVVAIMASVALGEEFYLGGIIGAVLIIVGLYLVLWGKNEERKFGQIAQANSRAGILSTQEHANNRKSQAKTSLTQPLIPPSTENV